VPAPQPRALSEVERKELRAVLNSEEHVDEAPATVYAKLLDEGVYLGSGSTMYRVLREHDEVHERRSQAAHPAAKKPKLIATKPNQCWSWDITKLLGPAKWTYYYLYVILDIFSHYVPGLMLAHTENATLAETLLADTVAKQNIERGQLTIHADRGSPMVAKPLAFWASPRSVEASTMRRADARDTTEVRPRVPASRSPRLHATWGSTKGRADPGPNPSPETWSTQPVPGSDPADANPMETRT
jgi:putative transposase